MPDFAANLSTMFTELPFAERFAAAARCGSTRSSSPCPMPVREGDDGACCASTTSPSSPSNLPAGRCRRERGIACHPIGSPKFLAASPSESITPLR